MDYKFFDDFEEGWNTNLVKIDGNIQLDVSQETYKRPIYVDHSRGSQEKVNYPLILQFNSQTLINEGKMRNDCRDVRIFSTDKYEEEEVIYEIPLTLVATESSPISKIVIDDKDTLDKIVDGCDIRVFNKQVEDPYKENKARIKTYLESYTSEKCIFWLGAKLNMCVPTEFYLYCGKNGAEKLQSTAIFLEDHDFKGDDVKYKGSTVAKTQTEDFQEYWSELDFGPEYSGGGYNQQVREIIYDSDTEDYVLHFGSEYSVTNSNCWIQYDFRELFFGKVNFDFKGDIESHPAFFDIQFMYDSENGYIFRIYGNGYIEFLKRLSTYSYVVYGTSTGINFDGSTFHNIEIERAPTSFIVGFDGNEIFEIQDKDIPRMKYLRFFTNHNSVIKMSSLSFCQTMFPAGQIQKFGNRVAEEYGSIYLEPISNPLLTYNFNYSERYKVQAEILFKEFGEETTCLVVEAGNVRPENGLNYIDSDGQIIFGGVETGKYLTLAHRYIFEWQVTEDSINYKIKTLGAQEIYSGSYEISKKDLQFRMENYNARVYLEKLRIIQVCDAPVELIWGEPSIIDSELEEFGKGEKRLIEDVSLLHGVGEGETSLVFKAPLINPFSKHEYFIEYGSLEFLDSFAPPEEMFDFYEGFDEEIDFQATGRNLCHSKWTSTSHGNTTPMHYKSEDGQFHYRVYDYDNGGGHVFRSLPTFFYDKKAVMNLKIIRGEGVGIDDSIGVGITQVDSLGKHHFSALRDESFYARNAPFSDSVDISEDFPINTSRCHIVGRGETYVEHMLGNDFRYSYYNPTHSLHALELFLCSPERAHFEIKVDNVGLLPYSYPEPIIEIGEEEVMKWHYGTGVRVAEFELNLLGRLIGTSLDWEEEVLDGTEILVEVRSSLDGGVNWTSWMPILKGNPIPNLNFGQEIKSGKIQIKMTFTAKNLQSTPKLSDFCLEIFTDYIYAPPEMDTDWGLIQDMQTVSMDNFHENTNIRWGTEIQLIKNRYALWQGLVGEIKTRIGECRGVGKENYGCDIWHVLGENIDHLVMDQITLYIKSLEKKYQYVDEIMVNGVEERTEGKIKLDLTVYSTFGEIRGDIIV